MKTTTEKAEFLQTSFLQLLHSLDPATPARWGKMNPHQMVEHFADAVMIAYGKLQLPALTSGEELQKMYAFLMSEKPFRENTKNPYLHDEPPVPHKAVYADSVAFLEKQIHAFFDHYAGHPDCRHLNPFFGNLNFEEQVQLLYKHALHHLRQFGIVVE
jgi:hypothetical protein